jgi:hypothetical protein
MQWSLEDSLVAYFMFPQSAASAFDGSAVLKKI